MREALSPRLGNPSSAHEEGRRARARLERAREAVALALSVHPGEIIFTSGGTEANQLAILGALGALEPGGRVLASAVEHRSVVRIFPVLAERGHDVRIVPVDRHGRVDPAAFDDLLDSNTRLASVQLVNNETGVVQPVEALARRARAAGALFHTDTVQALGKVPLAVDRLGVDLATFSGHKIYAPRGAGALYIRAGLRLRPPFGEGGQERGLRPGTENLPAIAAFARAVEIVSAEGDAEIARVRGLRDRLERAVLAALPEASATGAEAPRAAPISHMTFAGVETDMLIAALDLAGIAASGGAACTDGAAERSHVLAAMGIDERARGAVRLCAGRFTSDEEIDRAAAAIVQAVRRLGARRTP